MNRLPIILAAAAFMAAPAFGLETLAVVNHNGSTMAIERLDESAVRIIYAQPRDGLAKAGVTPGTVLFIGELIDGHFQGAAHTFKSGCDPVAYPVEGEIDPSGSITLAGPGPIRGNGCSVARLDWSSPHSTLEFNGDPFELVALLPQVEPPSAAQIRQVVAPPPVPVQQLPPVAPAAAIPAPAPVAPIQPAPVQQPVPVVVASPAPTPSPTPSPAVVTTPAETEETVAETVAPPPAQPTKPKLNLNIDF